MEKGLMAGNNRTGGMALGTVQHSTVTMQTECFRTADRKELSVPNEKIDTPRTPI